MPYIQLAGRDDRLGANITSFIAQIIYAHKNGFEIRYSDTLVYHPSGIESQKYLNTIFLETLFEFIKKYNSNIAKDDIEIKMFTTDYFEIISKVTLEVKMDLFTYFRKYILNDVKDFFKEKSLEKKFQIPFEPENTIVVHLRLDDVRDGIDYDGRLCAKEFENQLNSDKMTNANFDIIVKYKLGPQYNRQAPIPFIRIESYLRKIKIENPNFEIVVITNFGENISEIPYKVISNTDESYDLFLLCNAKHLIISRSTFSLSAIFFGNSEKYYVPLWGHASCFGLNTKFDNNNNIDYIY